MPCYDGDYPPTREEILNAKVPAMLCAIWGALKPNLRAILLNEDIDWASAGVEKSEFQEWWKQHEAADTLRREKELQEKEHAKHYKNAMSKLSPKEIEALENYKPKRY